MLTVTFVHLAKLNYRGLLDVYPHTRHFGGWAVPKLKNNGSRVRILSDSTRYNGQSSPIRHTPSFSPSYSTEACASSHSSAPSPQYDEWTTRECFQEEHQVEETLSTRIQGRFRATYAIGGMDPAQLYVYTLKTKEGGSGKVELQRSDDLYCVVIEKRDGGGWSSILRKPLFKCQLPLPAGLKIEELTCDYHSDEHVRNGSLVFHAPFADPFSDQSVPIMIRKRPTWHLGLPDCCSPHRLNSCCVQPMLKKLCKGTTPPLRERYSHPSDDKPDSSQGGSVVRGLRKEGWPHFWNLFVPVALLVGSFIILAEVYPYWVKLKAAGCCHHTRSDPRRIHPSD